MDLCIVFNVGKNFGVPGEAAYPGQRGGGSTGEAAAGEPADSGGAADAGGGAADVKRAAATGVLVSPPLRIDGPSPCWGTPFPQRDILCLTTSVGGNARKGSGGAGLGGRRVGGGGGSRWKKGSAAPVWEEEGQGRGGSRRKGTRDVDLARELQR